MEKTIFRQLLDYESFTFSYIIGCMKTRECIIVDPVNTMVQRDLNLMKELNLKLKYAVNTHVHADHITGSGLIKKSQQDVKSVISKNSQATADIYVDDKDVLKVGEMEFECLFTPGHTNGCITIINHHDSFALTGDALLIRGCGRTDFQEGSSGKLYSSVKSKILSLPSHYKLYPAHDYKGMFMTTVEEENLYNPRFSKSLEDFTTLMNNLNLAPPKKINEAVPMNLKCGLDD